MPARRRSACEPQQRAFSRWNALLADSPISLAAGRAHKVVTGKRGNLQFQASVIVDQGSERIMLDPHSRFQVKGRVPPRALGNRERIENLLTRFVALSC